MKRDLSYFLSGDSTEDFEDSPKKGPVHQIDEDDTESDEDEDEDDENDDDVDELEDDD